MFIFNVKGQDIDTLFVPKFSVLSLPDTTLFFERDTILYLPKTHGYEAATRQLHQSKAFYDSLKRKATLSKLAKRIYGWIVKEYKPPIPLDSLYAGRVISAQTPFVPFECMVIRKIRFKKVPVFAGSVYDTLKVAKRTLDKWGNSIHVNTLDRVLRRNLILRVGDEIYPAQVADAERILRNLPNIRDARIVFHRIAGDAQGVEMVVITQDVLSYGAEFTARGTQGFAASVFDKNIMGSGNELLGGWVYHNTRLPHSGYKAEYSMQNIDGSFISAKASYQDSYVSKGWQLNINRDFIIPQIKYGGGAIISHQTEFQEIEIKKDSIELTPVQSFLQDYWLAKSWLLSKKDKDFNFSHKRKNIVFALRYEQANFDERPFVSIDSNFRFHERQLFLGSLSYSIRYYRKSNLIFGFGRTEDIPMGFLGVITLGKEWKEFFQRPYFAASLRWAGYREKTGFLNVEWGMGFFWRNHTSQDGVENLKLTYFTPLLSIGKKYKFRQYVSSTWVRGFHRISEERVSVEDKSGVRGLKGFEMKGVRKWALNLESILFTPWYLYGFRMAMYGFMDVASVQNEFYKNFLFVGIGAGVRLRNERLAIREISLRIGFYPKRPSEASSFDFYLYTSPSLRLADIRNTKPTLMRLE
ncbi:MAG: hypothetical protein OHK0038_00120 [Flammeovirgaceae bacterium]